MDELRRVHRRKDGQMDDETNGMFEWVDGWMDGWTGWHELMGEWDVWFLQYVY